MGTPIGERVLSSPDKRLVIGDAVPTAQRGKLQEIFDQCGRLSGKERPGMEVVLEAVNGVLQNVKSAPNSASEFMFGLKYDFIFSRPTGRTPNFGAYPQGIKSRLIVSSDNFALQSHSVCGDDKDVVCH